MRNDQLAFIVVYKLVPETKSKSLEEIQGIWNQEERKELSAEAVAGEKRPLQRVK